MASSLFRATLVVKAFSAVLLMAAALAAQTQDFGPFPASLPPADAGVPYDYTLLPGFDEAIDSGQGVTISTVVSGDAPPGLTVSAGSRVSGVPTRPGTYTFQIAIRLAISDAGVDFAIRFLFTPTIIVRGTPTGGLSIEGGAVSFNFTQGATAPQTRTIRLINKGALARSVSATATSQPRGWLASSSGASVPAFSSTALSITANPTGLLPGVYSGSVEITASGGANEKFTVPAVIAITASGPNLTVSQTGVTFEVQQGSPAVPFQTFQVGGTTATALQFSATPTTIAGGSWLRVSPAASSASSTTSAGVTATVSAAGLAAGQYFGQIEIRADGANNSPRTVNAVLNVIAANALVAPVISPTAVVLVQRPGAAIAPQIITVTNVSNTTIPAGFAAAFDGSATGWFATKVSAATIAPGQTVNFEVTRQTSVRLSPGVYTGELSLRLGGNQRRVAVVLVIPPVPGNTASAFSTAIGRQLDGCTPTKLVPVFTTLGSAFAVTAAWPSALEMRVVDDCGDPLLRGAVTVSFNNGEPPLVMSATGEGRWSGTWQPKAGSQNVVLSAEARTADTPLLAGAAQIGGAAASNTTTPVIASGGVVNAATPSAGVPLAPGTYVSIYGSAMASGLTVAPSTPFPTDLAGTQVILAGKRLPLYFTVDGQINALVPYDVPLNIPQLLVVRRGNALSTPESVVVALAQPAVFTKNQSGTGEGIVVGARPDGAQFLVSPTAPAAAGDVLIIYCSGLGAVDSSIPAGSPAPSSPLARTISPVTVTVGGTNATVLFSGLTPSTVGLYQINALVPEGVAPGSAVELVLSSAGRSSGAVTVAIR